MRKEYLLGIIGDSIITGEVEITTRNGYPEFTACFNVGEAFDVDYENDEENIREYYTNLWEEVDDTTKVKWTNDCSITFDDWLDEQISNSSYEDTKDCSCTDLEMDFNGTTINFETISCGQCDVREYNQFFNMKFTNRKAFNIIMELWDNYHLKRVGDDVINKLQEAEKLLENFEWNNGKSVETFIENHLEM